MLIPNEPAGVVNNTSLILGLYRSSFHPYPARDELFER